MTDSRHRASGTILVVDDDPAVTRIVRAMLAVDGHRVETETSGLAVMSRLAQVRPDALLIDLNMPDADGAELVAEVRGRDPDLPVVVMTGEEDGERLTRLRGEAFACLIKPVALDRLLWVVSSAVQLRRMACERADLEAQLAVLLEMSSSATLVVDDRRRILFLNQAARQRARVEAPIGMEIGDALGGDPVESSPWRSTWGGVGAVVRLRIVEPS